MLFDIRKRKRARDPATPPADLTTLAEKGSSVSVRRLVASNPNTPLPTLIALAVEFPQEFLDNPVIPLLMLENPNLPADLPNATIERLLKQPSVPLDFMMGALRHKSSRVRWLIARSATVPVELLEILSRDTFEAVVQGVAQNPRTPVYVLEQIAATRPVIAARSPGLSATALETLAEDENADVRAAVAVNPKTPVRLLTKLARDPRAHVRVAVAGAKCAPQDMLARLARDPEERVRNAVEARAQAQLAAKNAKKP